MRPIAVLALAVALSIGCAEPPSKEMNQAQGAIDAAKAAGAETFAPKELAAAIEALRRSEEAVTQRDYRLALSHAIESREQATAAAKAAASQRTRTRGDIERELAEASMIVARGRERLKEPAVLKLPRRTLQDVRSSIETANKSVQDARTALNGDDYAAARQALSGVNERIQKANAMLDEALQPPPAPRKRR